MGNTVGTVIQNELEDSFNANMQNLRINDSCEYHGNVNQVLDQVLSRIKLQEHRIKQTNIFINDLVIYLFFKIIKLKKLCFALPQVKDKLITGLKEKSYLFGLLFQEIAWTGSFYEGLKISDPDEFDLNIVLKMPVKANYIEASTFLINFLNLLFKKFHLLSCQFF